MAEPCDGNQVQVTPPPGASDDCPEASGLALLGAFVEYQQACAQCGEDGACRVETYNAYIDALITVVNAFGSGCFDDEEWAQTETARLQSLKSPAS